MMSLKENHLKLIPASSPKDFYAAPLEVIEDIYRISDAEIYKISRNIFEYLANVSEDEILKGKIEHPKDSDNEDCKKYIPILNSLIQIATKNVAGGSRRILSSDFIEQDNSIASKKVNALAKCYQNYNSINLLSTLCDIANVALDSA